MPYRSMPALGMVMACLAVAPNLTAQASPPLAELGFIAGCWRGRTGSGSTIEEQFTAPTTNLILGLSRYTREGATRAFEFHTVSATPEGSRLVPHPGGRASVAFTEARRRDGHVAWENGAHDFPQRIGYTRIPGDSVVVRIELLDGSRATEYRMGRVACGEG